MEPYWQDVFLTTDAEASTLDTFIMPVQSVDIKYGTTAEATTMSTLLLCAFPNMEHDVRALRLAQSIKPGSLIRVGGAHTSGFTDYLTVLEKLDVGYFYARTDGDADTTGGRLTAGETIELHGTNRICFRVNFAIDATTLPSHITPADQLGAATDELSRGEHRIRYQHNNSSGSDKYYYPMYLYPQSSGILRAHLPSNIHFVHELRLMGYKSTFSAPGVHAQHEVPVDDWYALRIDEIQGRILSNNQSANGAMYCIQAGTSREQVGGSAEMEKIDTVCGFAQHIFDPPRHMAMLTARITRPNGQQGYPGRLHLWIKLKCS